MRVAFVNNYSPPETLRLVREGTYPRHHLFGVDTLAGHEIAYVPLDCHRRLKAASIRLGSRLGDLDVELRLWRAEPRPDCIVAAKLEVILGLLPLRAAGLFDIPLVAFLNSDMPPTAQNRLRLRGLDFAFAETRVLERQLRDDFGRGPDTFAHVRWGPALDFPLYTSLGEERIVSTGKTHRDTATLLEALAEQRLPARVYVAERPANVPDSVDLVVEDEPVGHATALDDLRRASIVAIPLSNGGAPYGITELNDALALSKPVVMTRIPQIDVDIEAIGCGIWVEPGDVEGWRSALARLASDEDLRRRMGRAGREFAERNHNYELCGRVLADGLDRVMRRTGRTPRSAGSHQTSEQPTGHRQRFERGDRDVRRRRSPLGRKAARSR